MNYDELKEGDIVEIMVVGATGRYTARVVEFDSEGAPRLEVFEPKGSIFAGKPYLKDEDFLILRRVC